MHLLALHTNPVRSFISSVGSSEEMVPCPRVPRCLRVLSDLRSGLLRIERCLLLAAEWTVRCPCSCANEYGTSPAKGTVSYQCDRDGTRAVEIVNRVRLLFKKAALQREVVDLNEIIREMMRLLHGEATQFAVLVRAKLAAYLPQVMGDGVQLQQVLMNLMMNSIER
jgi:signal transduction histidine kinase